MNQTHFFNSLPHYATIKVMFILKNDLKTAAIVILLAAIMQACSVTTAPSQQTATQEPDSTLTHQPTPLTTTPPTATATPIPGSTQPTMPPSRTVAPVIPVITFTPPVEEGPPGVEVIDGPEISWNGVRFDLDPVLGSTVFMYDEQIGSPDGLTAHYTRFALTEEDYCQTWCVQVYPVEQFHEAFGRFVFPPAGYGGGAAIILHAQDKQLNFQNGEGDRSLEIHGQMSYFVSNESLSYNFRGTTHDQQYAVYIRIPVSAPILASTDNPEENSNPDAILIPTALPDAGYSGDAILTYNEEAVVQLDLLAPAAFDPDLSVLDALVASLHIEVNP
jgi:hypothetical protein